VHRDARDAHIIHRENLVVEFSTIHTLFINNGFAQCVLMKKITFIEKISSFTKLSTLSTRLLILPNKYNQYAIRRH